HQWGELESVPREAVAVDYAVALGVCTDDKVLVFGHIVEADLSVDHFAFRQLRNVPVNDRKECLGGLRIDSPPNMVWIHLFGCSMVADLHSICAGAWNSVTLVDGDYGAAAYVQSADPPALEDIDTPLRNH